jgi:hypothetical protein
MKRQDPARALQQKERPGPGGPRVGASAAGVVRRSGTPPGSEAALRTPGNALQGAVAVPGQPVGGGCNPREGWY